MRDIKNDMKSMKKNLISPSPSNDAHIHFLDNLQDLRGKLKREALERCGRKKEVVNANHKVQTWRLEVPPSFKRSNTIRSSILPNSNLKEGSNSPKRLSGRSGADLLENVRNEFD